MKSDNSNGKPKPCPCGSDDFADLPPEMRPRPQRRSDLRQVACAGCGLVYSTNRATALCMTCEKERHRHPRSENNES